MKRKSYQDNRDREIQRDLLGIAVLQFTIETRQKHTRVEAMIALMQKCFSDQPTVLAQIQRVSDRMRQPIPENLT